MACLYRRRGKLRLAEGLFRDLLSMQQAAFGMSSKEVAMTMYQLAELYSDQQQYQRAKRFYAKSAEIWQALGLNNESILWYSDALLKLQHMSDEVNQAGEERENQKRAG